MKPTTLHARPTCNGLWHPVDGCVVGEPVEVHIHTDDEKKRHFSLYTFGVEEISRLNDWKAGTRWMRYRAPKVTR